MKKWIDQLLCRTEQLVLEGQWDQALLHAKAAGDAAEITQDRPRMVAAADHLDRLRDLRHAGRLHAIAGRMFQPSALQEWDGSSLADRTLLIVRRTRHIGAQLRDARLIAQVASDAARCILQAEPRVAPLFRRSFPEVEVIKGPEDLRMAPAEAEVLAQQVGADVIASYETLWQYLAGDEASLLAGFKPLRPDPMKVRVLRERYTGQAGRVIGISWRSTNAKKDFPSLADWTPLLQLRSVAFVSLQYGDVDEDLDYFAGHSGTKVIHDRSIDSLRDLDSFAAQVAAMDAVITISNTGAHMAGALGVPTTILLDDKVHLVWPVRGSRTPWYPSVTLVRKQGRAWSDILAGLET